VEIPSLGGVAVDEEDEEVDEVDEADGAGEVVIGIMERVVDFPMDMYSLNSK